MPLPVSEQRPPTLHGLLPLFEAKQSQYSEARARRWRFSVLTGIGLLAGSWAPLPGQAQTPDPRRILRDSLAPSDLAYVGTQVSVARGPAGTRTETQKVFRQGNRLRINFLDGRTLVDDGTQALVYFPRRNTVVQSRSSAEAEET
ncbi:MAG: hypothetical protein FJX77_14450, partial [Armatimonadetes bacterium]|nr:hypothetical protein [Armatimonadota bacterium]